MAWEATDEVVGVGGGGPSGWTEEQPTSWWDRAKGVGQTVDDAVRATANAVTFGMADRLAGLTGGGTDAQVKLSEDARKRSPYASIGGDIAGAVALPGAGGARLATNLGGKALGRAFGYGAEGAGIGALQGAGNTYSGKAQDYVDNAVKGGVMGGIFGGLGGAAFGPRPMVSSAKTSLDDVADAKDIAYKTLERNRAGYDRDFLAGTANTLDAGPLYKFYNKTDIPTTQAALERMRNLPRQFVSPDEVESIRKGINTIPGERTTDIAAGRHVKEALDRFYANPPKGAVRPGTEAEAALAGHQAGTARDLAAAQFRMQKMADIREAAEQQAARGWSGLNVENSIRQQVSQFINPKTGGRSRLAGYTPEEQAALREVVFRGGAANVGRWAGNIAAGGGGVAVPVAMMAGNEFVKQNPELSAAVPAAGLALRALSNRAARKSIGRAEDLISQRNPLYTQRAATAPMVRGGGLSAGSTQAMRDAMTLELLRQQGVPRITVTPRDPREE